MPADRGVRKRVSLGIYHDRSGFSACVAVGSGPHRRQKEKRYPHGTGLRTMQRWQDLTRAVLLKAHAKRTRTRGTLAGDVERYLPTIRSRPCYEARRAELAAWVAVFGHRRRHDLATTELQTQLEAWHSDGYATTTLNHRLTSLRALYLALDGPDEPNPTTGLRRYREPDLEPRALSYADVEAILAAMPVSDTQARLRVIAYTGLPHIRLGRLKPEHVAWSEPSVWLEGRRKGKGTRPKRIPLLAKGVEALRVLAARGAWGPFSRSGAWVSFDRARQKVNRERTTTAAEAGVEPVLIPPCRPYDLRHTFGTYAYLVTRDIRATAELLDCTPETAMRYARAAVQPNVAAIVAALNAQFAPPPA